MRFGVLGPLALTGDHGDDLHLTRPKQRRLLASLLLRPNKNVCVDQLADDVWGSEPPSSARNNLKTYVCGLRKLNCSITTTADGYRVNVNSNQLDLLRFEEVGAGSPVARKLWRGPVLQGLSLSPATEAIGTRLQDLHLRALEDVPPCDVDSDLLYSLYQALDIEPFRESLHAHMMSTLHYLQRTGQALQVYHQLAGRLEAELGVRPGREVQVTYEQIVSARSDSKPPHPPRSS